MELLIIGLILYFGGKWLIKITGPMPHLCRNCVQKYYGDHCPRCADPMAVRGAVEGEYESPG